MNKTELIKEVAHKSKLPKDQAAKAVNEIINSITSALQTGEEVKINDFGAFQVTEKSERKGRNPQTGEEIKIAASKVPQFKAAKTLKDAVNQRDFIETSLATGKINEEEAKVLAFVMEKYREEKANGSSDEAILVEVKAISEALELEFTEAEILVNRLIGKRILNTEVFTSRLDHVFLRANYRKFI